MAAPPKDFDIEWIREEYRAGASLRALGNRHGVHWTTVRKHLEAAGEPIRRSTPSAAAGRRRNIPLDMTAVKAGYAAGLSPAALGRQYGVGQDTIRRRLQAAGVELRGHNKAMALATRKGDAEGLAEDLGVPAEELAVLLARHGFL
jgi:hypothetical protein